MILIDFSQIALSSLFHLKGDLSKNSGKDVDEVIGLIRHSILNSIRSINQNFGNKYGRVILACDGKKYWRKDLFPYYKASRARNRKDSDTDWTLIFDTISRVKDEIGAHFPYKVIHFDDTEADDIIAVLCKHLSGKPDSEYDFIDFLGSKERELEPILIVSSDGDFKQLHKYKNVEQYNPVLKKKVVCDDPIAYLAGHIAKAGDDGIPNVLSEDNVLITDGVKQNRMVSARLNDFIKSGRDACRNDFERRNWDRNSALINLDLIPKHIEDKILNKFHEKGNNKSKMDVLNYLIRNKCRMLIDHIEDFF